LIHLLIYEEIIQSRVIHCISNGARADIKMKGIEFLRGVYISSGMGIKPKTRVSKIDALKELIRAWGLKPEEILTRDALQQPHRTVIDRSQMEDNQLAQLTRALRQEMLKEIRENSPQSSIHAGNGKSSPGEIRTLVNGSKGHYAWPLHHRALAQRCLRCVLL
jgi:hypothetical protein